MDIVPIQLSLTEGDLITLWAPRWREDGEEWEGFLGDSHGVHAFPDAAELAAYVRTVTDHDLIDHPAWPLVPTLTAPDLVPTEDQCYDLVGVPEIVADEPDTWILGELANIIDVVRSLADSCELDRVHEVLHAAEGFAYLDDGTMAFSGREGTTLWTQLAQIVASRWDEVVDAIDGAVRVPTPDPDAVATARHELTAPAKAGQPREVVSESGQQDHAPRGDVAEFWEQVGIDPILIVLDDGDYYTLRSYLDDQPVFLGAAGRIYVLPSSDALARYLSTEEAASDHDLTKAATWSAVLDRAAAGTLAVEIDPQNVYQLCGIGEDLSTGPEEVDPHQLDLGVELLRDVGRWADDDSTQRALSRSQSLGWLTSFILSPDVNRLAPSPPFDAEVVRWNGLVTDLARRLRRR